MYVYTYIYMYVFHICMYIYIYMDYIEYITPYLQGIHSNTLHWMPEINSTEP